MNKRSVILSFLLVWSLIFSLFKIVYIMNDDRYTSVGEMQSSLTVEIDKARGTIYDRNMIPITNTIEVFRGSVINTPEVLKWIDANFQHEDKHVIFERLKSGKPIVVESPVKPNIEGTYFLKCGVYYAEKSIIADHIIGYLDVEGNGITGIEKAYNDYLRNGASVRSTYYLDARNNVLSGVDLTVDGTVSHDYKKGVVLTLDSKIQNICEEAVKNKIKTGAVIVQDISSGEIIASVSLPEYSIFDVKQALDDVNSPLINRSFASFNVGSVFKLCIAAAALENGYTESFEYECTGNIMIGSTVYNCNKHDGHGKITMREAITHSCNTYFINLAINVGCAEVYKTAYSFGFGQADQICLGMKTESGVLPELYELQKNIGELANFAFGQGKLLATPLQISGMISAIANGGIYIEPTLVKKIVDEKGEVISSSQFNSNRIIKAQTAEILKQLMIETVNEGTGVNAQISCGAGGKTASAETGRKLDGKNVTQCWFSGFFPAQNSKYAITVLVENGTSGSASAAPVFADIAEKIYILEGLS